MITRRLSNQLVALADEDVLVKGWVHQIRDLGGVSFVTLRDAGGLLQVVVGGEQLAASRAWLTRESIVAIRGRVKREPRAPGGVELQAAIIEPIVVVSGTAPIELSTPRARSRHTIDTLLENRALSVRHPEARAIFRIQGEIAWRFAEYLRGRDFVEIHTSKLVSSGTEGGSELFSVSYFERKALLAQSPQFYKQIMVGSGFERVFEVGPVYRAEKHATIRHLNEYVSLDVEMGFIEDEGDLMDLEVALLRHVFDGVAASCPGELALLGRSVPRFETIPRLTLAEARARLATLGKRLGPDDDLDPEAERVLCESVAAETGAPLIFVTHYPRSVRPMYAMPDPASSGLTRSFDLLYDGLEITTGGQRIHEHAMLVDAIRGRGLDPASFGYYLQAFEYGMPPHGGFAIGLERLTKQLLGLRNIREASLFPRDRNRLAP